MFFKRQSKPAYLLKLAAFSLFLAATSSTIQAKTIYQCQDNQGRTAFSDGPCQQQTLGNKAKAEHGKSHGDTGTASNKAKPPAKLMECNKQSCKDSQGQRYNKLNGDLYVSTTGLSCKRAGQFIYCR